MQELLLQNYLWVKSIHIIAVMAWMAGLLYLPRLFVYHSQTEKGSDVSETLKIMERKLLRLIMNPAMIVSWIFGLLMLWANPALLSNGWMHVKLTAIILLTVVHMVFAKWRKNFEAEENTRAHKFFRIWNEAPTLLMVVIVIMAVAEPF
jgi:putative membrane protein